MSLSYQEKKIVILVPDFDVVKNFPDDAHIYNVVEFDKNLSVNYFYDYSLFVVFILAA